MDYKQKYKDLVKAVKELQEANPSDEGIQNWINENVPELAESGDERIRKELIEHIKANKCADYVLFKKFSPDDVIAWLEKQKPIDENEFAKGVLIRIAMSIMQWLDDNLAEGNMCLSNMECEDLENAVRNSDWQKVYGYMKKKLEKQGIKPQGKPVLETAKEAGLLKKEAEYPSFDEAQGTPIIKKCREHKFENYGCK